jgi:carboxylate-amine ligase
VLSLTVGVEEELMLVDPASGRLLARIEDVLRRVDGDERIRAELRAAQVELVTRPYLSSADVGRELAVARLELAAALGDEMALIGCGAHPTTIGVGPVTNGERYREIARDNPWAARTMLTCGLHVHVALADGDRALAVYNALRSFLPEFAVLSANSPYSEGSYTGVASARLQLNRSLARFGVPPIFQDWAAYAEFTEWGRVSGTIPDPSYHWWDLRLHPGYGTLELRVCDTQTEIGDTVALVALAQTLVAWLAQRYDAGEPLPVHDGHRITESVWLGMRAGAPAELLDLDTGERQPTVDRITALLEALAPTAGELGTWWELTRLLTLAVARGADRQEKAVREQGLCRLVDWLARGTLDSAHAYRGGTGVLRGAPSALEGDQGVDPVGRSVPTSA